MSGLLAPAEEIVIEIQEAEKPVIEGLTKESNEKIRDTLMETQMLGPENTQEANTEFWRGLANVWRISPDQARRRLCANCEYFDDAPETLEAMEVVPQDEFDKDGGGRGYCHKFEFICHNLRVCKAWEKDMKEEDDE
ncbi:high potential iron-sulfur protein [Caudoviricetes sp.]|nr:high potential iron-sulfur protein [Caudoviricetes sp.]UOF78349.1 high potential iron-sulfur protein [Bacteriophage sp.]